MKTGIVSVTFRQLPVEEIIKLAVTAKLDGIEWGSDIHCPVGDLSNARRVRTLTEENGIETISYGSYYRVGEHDNFAEVLETAEALNAPNIRVWAGSIPSGDASTEQRNALISDARKIADMAKECGITVSFEYHGGTLTDTQESAVRLLGEIDSDNIFTYWQPLNLTTHEQNLQNIDELVAMNKLKNIHAYHWIDGERFPLFDGEKLWQEYIEHAKSSANAILLEFVKGDTIAQFEQDIKTLRGLLNE